MAVRRKGGHRLKDGTCLLELADSELAASHLLEICDTCNESQVLATWHCMMRALTWAG